MSASLRDSVCGLGGRTLASDRLSDAPDGVKRGLVEREQPARCDPLIDDVIQADGGPAMLDAADRGQAVNERGDSVSVADQDVSSPHLKGLIGEFRRRRK